MLYFYLPISKLALHLEIVFSYPSFADAETPMIIFYGHYLGMRKPLVDYSEHMGWQYRPLLI